MPETIAISNELLKLAKDLEKFKIIELKAKEGRIGIEEKIIGLIVNDKMEGSVSVSNDDFNLSVTNGVTRKVDFEALTALDSELPDHLKLVDVKNSLNLKNLRTLEQNAGERFLSSLSEAIILKPKKVSVVLKLKEKK